MRNLCSFYLFNRIEGMIDLTSEGKVWCREIKVKGQGHQTKPPDWFYQHCKLMRFTIFLIFKQILDC